MPIASDVEPGNWPTNIGSSAFWEALGRAVATFSRLEDAMFRAWIGLTGTRELKGMTEADVEAAYFKWKKEVEQAPNDALGSLTKKLESAFNDDSRVDNEISDALLDRLDEVRDWRNALCHGTWEREGEDDSVCLRRWERVDDKLTLSETYLSVQDLSSIRIVSANLIIDLMDIVSAAGVSFPGTALPGATIAGGSIES